MGKDVTLCGTMSYKSIITNITAVIYDNVRKYLLSIWLGKCVITHCSLCTYVDDVHVITLVIVHKSL